MCIFAIEKIEAVRTTGKVHFFKLVKNGKCLFDYFYNTIIKDEKHKKIYWEYFQQWTIWQKQMHYCPKRNTTP